MEKTKLILVVILAGLTVMAGSADFSLARSKGWGSRNQRIRQSQTVTTPTTPESTTTTTSPDASTTSPDTTSANSTVTDTSATTTVTTTIDTPAPSVDLATSSPSDTTVVTTPTSTSTDTPTVEPVVVTVPEPEVTPVVCLAPSANPAIASIGTGVVGRLSAIQKLTDTQPFTQASIFMPTPTNNTEAVDLAYDVRAQFAKLRSYGLAPVVFFEPTTLSGGRIPLKQIADGVYSVPIDKLFSTLKQIGVTDSQIGTWVAYPEINTPAWDRTGFSTENFGPMVNGFSKSIKTYFPKAKVGILMESFSYQLTSSLWENGQATSWLPYLSQVNSGAIDVVGMQAFWFPPDQFSTLFSLSPDLGYMLDTALAKEAMKALGVREMLIQTGTPHKINISWLGQIVTIDLATRTQALNGIKNSVSDLTNKGYGVTLSLFTENKFNTDEAKDWSYYTEDKSILKDFTDSLYCAGNKLVIF